MRMAMRAVIAITGALLILPEVGQAQLTRLQPRDAPVVGIEVAKPFIGDSGLDWYHSSDTADRGFCKHCGSSLFWRPAHGEYLAVMAGALDAPTGLSSREHIYVDDASDYYEINDGLPQFGQDSGNHCKQRVRN